MLSKETKKELQIERFRLLKRVDAIAQILDVSIRNGPVSELGLRDAMRQILRIAGVSGLKPMAVMERLQELDFDDSSRGATTELIVRVRNELWRMAQKGELQSNRGSYFFPQEKKGSRGD